MLRCRCAVELHAIALKKAEPKSEGRFAIAMLEQERTRFLDGICGDTTAYVTSSFCIATTFLLLILSLVERCSYHALDTQLPL